MSQSTKPVNVAAYAIPSLAVMIGAVVYAAVTGLWFVTAIPIGLLFGFFLQKGDLCGSSAFSEVLLMRDARKLWGLWVCIVTGMAVFAVMNQLGWITLAPKPFLWASHALGGLIFGLGTALAGGCISGCLFKAGAGNLNSMAAIPAIALGVAMVEFGPLSGFNKKLQGMVIKSSSGGPVTLPSLTGIPYWALAILFVTATLAAALWMKRRGQASAAARGVTAAPEPFCLKKKLLARTWKHWQAGLLIGLLGGAAYLSSAATGRNYPLGVTHGVVFTQLLITDSPLQHGYKKPAAPPAPPALPPGAVAPKKVSWWLILLVISLVAGAWVSGRLSGEARLLPKPPE